MMDCAFFKEGCETMARNARELLSLAGEPVTAARIVSIVETAPRSVAQVADDRWRTGACNRLLAKASNLCTGDADRARFLRLLRYFLEYMPSRNPAARDLIDAAFDGVLGGIGVIDEGELFCGVNPAEGGPER